MEHNHEFIDSMTMGRKPWMKYGTSIHLKTAVLMWHVTARDNLELVEQLDLVRPVE